MGRPPAAFFISSSYAWRALACAWEMAATIRSSSISTSFLSTHAGSRRISFTSPFPSTVAVTIPPPEDAVIFWVPSDSWSLVMRAWSCCPICMSCCRLFIDPQEMSRGRETPRAGVTGTRLIQQLQVELFYRPLQEGFLGDQLAQPPFAHALD